MTSSTPGGGKAASRQPIRANKKPSAGSKKTASQPRRRAAAARPAVAEGVNLPTSGRDAVAPEGLPSPPVVETEGEVTARKAGTAIRVRLFRGATAVEDADIEALPALVRDDRNLAWIDLSEYGQADLEHVAGLLGLHPLTVRATLGDWERPRVDVFPDYFYMSATVARADQSRRKLVAGELNMIVGRNYLVTAHKLPLEFADKIVDRLAQSPEVATLHTAYALYIALDELIEYYQGLFEHIDEEIEEAEERALTEDSDQFLADLLALKRYIFVLARFAEQHRSVFAVLTRPDFTHISGEDIVPYFKDLQENLDRLIDRLAAARDSVTQAFDVYVSQVSHRTNALIKVLTLISTVVLPTTLIVGFFSTNFSVVGQLRSLTAFWIMVAALIITPIAILLFIRGRRLV